MAAVLGIDSAWTDRHASGVAVAVEQGGRWRLVALAPSYRTFLDLGRPGAVADAPATDHVVNAGELLDVAQTLAGSAVDLVAIDMPMARTAIQGRRAADDAVSRLYGGRKCGTHSPSSQRPGAISDLLRAGFERSGYGLCTEAILPPGLIEVYPHPALLELTGAAERLPYKAAKTRTYWKEASREERRFRLLDQWAAIVAALDREIGGVAAALPAPDHGASGGALKAYEDMVDAVVCVWCAIRALAGHAFPYGDQDAAIWIPVTVR